MRRKVQHRLRKAAPRPLELEHLEERCLPSSGMAGMSYFAMPWQAGSSTADASEYSQRSATHNGGSYSQPSLATFFTTLLQGGRQRQYSSSATDPYGMTSSEHYPSTSSDGTSTNSSAPSAQQGDNGDGTAVIVVMPFAVNDTPSVPVREAGPSVPSSSTTVELTFGVTGLTAPLWRPAPAGAVQRSENALSVDFSQGPVLWHLPNDIALLLMNEAEAPNPSGKILGPTDSTASRTHAGTLMPPRGGDLLAGLTTLDLPGLKHVVDQFFAALGHAADPLAAEGLAQRLAPWVVVGVLAGGALLEWRRNQEGSAGSRGRGRWAGLPEIVPLTEDAP